MLLLTYIITGVCSEILVRTRTHSLAPTQLLIWCSPSSRLLKCTKKFSSVLFFLSSYFLLAKSNPISLFTEYDFFVFTLSFLLLLESLMTFELSQLFCVSYPSTFILIYFFVPILALKDNCTMSKL